MNARPFALTDLSSIAHRLTLVERETKSVLVVSFQGLYRDGSAGNADARLMRAVVVGAVTASGADAVVLDLRELTYRWGDKLLDVFVGAEPGGFRSLAYAMVVSERCEAAVRSLLADDTLIFRDLEGAVAHAAAGAQRTVELEDALEPVPLEVVVRDDPSVAEMLSRTAAVAVRVGLAVEESALVRAWSCGLLAVRVKSLSPEAFAAARTVAAREVAAVDGAWATIAVPDTTV